MLGQILRSLFRDEVRAIRRTTAGVGLGLQGAVVLLGALLFATLALFLWLAERLAPWQAALVVAAILAALGGVLIGAGRRLLRRNRRRAGRDRAAAADLRGRLSGDRPDPDPEAADPATTPSGIVSTALIAGIMIGRFLRR